MDVRENTRFVYFDTILLVLVIFFGLAILANSGNKFESAKKPVACLVRVNDNYAINTPIVRLQVFQKISISNKDNFSLLAFNRNPVAENKKINTRVGQLLLIRQSLSNIPQFISRYHLFPREMDDPHFLS